MSRFRSVVCIFGVLVQVIISTGGTGQALSDRIERNSLVEDARYIASTIEDVHPDPYIAGGGRVAFHRRMHEIIRGIPAEGLTKAEFYFHLRPLVTAVGDAHTWLNSPEMTYWPMPGGVPLYFWVVERSLYVRGVFRDEDRGLIGCRLSAIEGVPYGEIVRRAARVISHDNEYQVLRNLAAYGQIFQGVFLKRLLPEWSSENSITVTLEHPNGSKRDHVFKVPTPVSYPPKCGETALEPPPTEKCDFVYEFLGDDRKTALLVISGMMQYREALEMWRSYGGTNVGEQAKEAYKRFHGNDPSGDVDLVIEGVPSVTEVFRDLVREMKEAGTENLVIDIRRNGGGNSYMAPILVYFLYGRDGLAETIEAGSEVTRYSQAYLDRFEEVDLDALNSEREVPITIGGYDFASDREIYGEPSVEERFESFERMVKRMPTFEKEYGTGGHAGFYRPKKVLVVAGHDTFSSGFTLLRYLCMGGAEFVGTPSAQAANCFGDILSFELPRSGLTFTVSRKTFVLFPGDPERGRVLKPHYPLTYEKLREYRFDRNAALLYALEIARR